MLTPPEKYTTWLEYAIETMDTRSLFNEQSHHWPLRAGVQRQEMRDSAFAELEKLKAEKQTCNEGKVIDHSMIFCPFCGGKIKEEII